MNDTREIVRIYLNLGDSRAQKINRAV